MRYFGRLVKNQGDLYISIYIVYLVHDYIRPVILVLEHEISKAVHVSRQYKRARWWSFQRAIGLWRNHACHG